MHADIFTAIVLSLHQGEPLLAEQTSFHYLRIDPKMRKPEIWKLVLAQLLPAKSEFSTSDWRTYVNRYLIPEIHTETIRFYGNNDTIEAIHPGLDYASKAGRLRLGKFPRHNQLFGVFDKLRLCDSEIRALCRWEGTYAAKEAYERRVNQPIIDTTWDGVHEYALVSPRAYVVSRAANARAYIRREAQGASASVPIRHTDLEYLAMSIADNDDVKWDEAEETFEEEEDEEEALEEESEDELQQSVGEELNQRLLAATEARARGEDATMDAEWEQWMKDAIERGVMPELSSLQTLSQDLRRIMPAQAPIPRPDYASPARALSRSHAPSQHTPWTGMSALPLTSAAERSQGTQWVSDAPESSAPEVRRIRIAPSPQNYPEVRMATAPHANALHIAPSTGVPS